MTEEFDDHEELDATFVRPFMLTKGRTRSSGVNVVMESLVDRKPIAEATYDKLEPVSRDIWNLLADRLSAAEVSAMLHLPLGIVCVLIGDMAGLDLVQVHETTASGDAVLLRRLIDGVRAL